MRKLAWISAALLLLIAPGMAGCGAQNPASGGFAIYMHHDDVRASDMASSSHYELANSPVISLYDIISYAKDTHEIELTARAYTRITEPIIQLSGKVFVVCVDKKPIYWGAFWSPFSSQSFDGVTIWVPAMEQGNVIRLRLGYPSPDYYQGKDPRSNPEIIQSLEKAGKLK